MDIFNAIRSKLESFFQPQQSPQQQPQRAQSPQQLNNVMRPGQNITFTKPVSNTQMHVVEPPHVVTPTPQGQVQAAQTQQPQQQSSQQPQQQNLTDSQIPLSQLEQIISKGLNKYHANLPLLKAAHALAVAGQGLPDPYLPATIALKETSGGQHLTSGANNIFNMLPNGQSVDYPDMNTAIMGGNGQGGFNGVIHNGIYNDYLQSGDLGKFFNHFTPPGAEHGNADLASQLDTYRQLHDYFQP